MTILTDTKTEKVADLISAIHPSKIEKILVVGCGSGLEAAILAQKLNAEVTGIDIEADFDPAALQFCDLSRGDAMALEFDREQFDFIFSYHALEHIDEPALALGEMLRVLKKGGGFWIGTPNKSRILGYIGSKNTSFSEKLRWNFLDWRMRLTGRFENRFGAHAGFGRAELRELLTSVFDSVDDRTYDYFSEVYPNKGWILKSLEKSGLSQWAYPSVYFSGKK